MSVQTELDQQNTEVSPGSLFTVVKAKDGDDTMWKEVADVVNVSSTGAGFFLHRECHVGGLISMMIPLPSHLRCYDHDKELYKVWGLVQHCHKETTEDGFKFHVGVAFIGKNTPASYDEDPRQTYRICGVNTDGLWKVAESKTPFKKRQHPRFWKSIDLYLALIDTKHRTVRGERTFTENISRSGAAVFTSLEIGEGDRVKFICEQYDFSGLAVVCNRNKGDDGKTRLHLQFIESMFPIERVNLPEAVVDEPQPAAKS